METQQNRELLDNRPVPIPLAFSYYLGALYVILLSLIWPYECPSRLKTSICGLLIYTIGFSLLLLGKRHGYLSSVKRWNIVFLLKLTVSWAILVFFWVGPLQPDHFRAAGGNHFDGMLYDYHAAAIAASHWTNAARNLNAIWLSFGVVAYAATIYTIFGINIWNVALCNALLSLIACLALAYGFEASYKNPKFGDYARWCMLLPFASYYDALVTKETPCTLFFLLGFAGCAHLFAKSRRPWRGLLLIGLGFVGLAIFRVNVALLLGVCVLAVATIRLRKAVKYGLGILMAGLVAGAVFVEVAPSVTNELKEIVVPSSYFQNQKEFFARVSATAPRLRVIVARVTMPTNFANLVALAPLRIPIWLFSPYPQIIPIHLRLGAWRREIQEDPENLSGMLSVVLGCLSAWILCLGAPYLLSFFDKRVLKLKVEYLVAAIFMAIPSILIANLVYMGARRYRLPLEPIAIMAILTCVGLRRPKIDFRVLIYGIIFGGLLAYFLVAFSGL